MNEDALSFYLLGAYITDGCLSSKNEIEITSTDEDWLLQIRDQVSPGRNVHKIKKSNCYSFDFYHKDIWNWLNSHECTPRKSYTAKFPVIPEQFYPDLFRGMLDGDGSISMCIYTKTKKNNKQYTYNKLGVYICTASKDLIQGMHECLLKQKIKHSISETNDLKRKPQILNGKEIKATVNTWRITFSDKTAIEFLKWIYYPGHFIAMPRKFKLFIKALGIFDSGRESLSVVYNT